MAPAIPQKRFKIIGPDGRAVCYLKRMNGRVGVWYAGMTFWHTRRGNQPVTSSVLQGEASYPEKIAKGWIKSLEKAGDANFKMVQERSNV